MIGGAAVSLNLQKGAIATTAVSVVALGGFTGSVSLIASGLPAGVTASFSPATVPASATGASVLTLTGGNSAIAGISTVTVTGASGALSHAATISLNVMTPTAGSMPVSLASLYNVTAAVTDGSTFPPSAWMAERMEWAQLIPPICWTSADRERDRLISGSGQPS